MIKKKFVILLALIMITTGCSVNYEITLDDESIKELVQVTEKQVNITENSAYKTGIDVKLNLPQHVYINANVNPYDETQIIEGVEYYEKNLIDNGDLYGLSLSYNHLIDKYNYASTINQCYQNISVVKNDNTIALSTSRNNLCFKKYENLEEINISINFDSKKYEVLTQNADQCKNGKCTWNINTSNYNDKSIVIELEKKSTVNNKNNQNSIVILIGFIIIIIVIGLLIYFIGSKTNKNKNEI